MENSYKKELLVAKKIAYASGRVMRRYFLANDQGKEIKKDNSLVTVADKKINSLVIKEISRNFDDGVIGEEKSSTKYGMGRRWFCDPIDGTKAFVWGTPTAMFSLALVVDGKPVLGVAYDPFLDMLYEAVQGCGSYCNRKRIHVSDKGLSGEHVAVTSSLRKVLKNFRPISSLIREGVRVATFSGAVYKACLVARGKFVGYFEAGVNAHDMAAVHVIVKEAGGKCTRYDGTEPDYSAPFKSAVISNRKVHKKLVEIANLH